MVRQVLLVEADSATSSLQIHALQALGYRVRAVSDGLKALKIARNRQPDVILIGTTLDDDIPSRLCQALKLDPSTNLLGVVRIAPPEDRHLDIEPDAYLCHPSGRSAISGALGGALAAVAERRGELVRSEVRWRLPSDGDALEAFTDQFLNWVSGSSLTGFQTQQLGMAIRELAANAIEWGHHYERERIVSVNARLDTEKVSVLIRDHGTGFNPRALPHAARPGDPISHLTIRAAKQLREGGFGILMATGLLDHLCYNDVGNEALAIKFLPQRLRLTAERFGPLSATASS